MADGTKAVVDTSVADEAALAMAIEDIEPEDGSTAAGQGSADEAPDAASDAPDAVSAPAAATARGESPESTSEGTSEGSSEVSQQPSRAAGDAAGAQVGKAASAAVAAAVTAREPASDDADASTGADELPDAAVADGAEAGTRRTTDAAPRGSSAGTDAGESTAQLSATELAAELTARGAAAPARRPSRSGRPAPQAPVREDRPVVSTETLDADTGTLPAAKPAPLRHSGDKIGGRYRLEECITQSETFSSWRAVDEKLRRAVGVHLMAAGHRRAKAVLTAARSAALLNDPRFVQVLDAVQEGDLVYVVREWLPDASDLAHLLADGPMEPYDAYQMVRQVTDAVAAAHRRGQAHLRLTPRCVLRTDTGQYRINGIAVDAALRGLPTEEAERTDTRAIGALLFAALTHRWPYPEDRYDLRGMPKSLGCVPPDQVRAGVHKGLSELAARALCEHPPHHQDPITTPEQLAKAIALMPKIRQPEQPAPAFTAKPKPKPHTPPHPAGAHAAGRPTPPARPQHTALQEAVPASPRPRRPRRLVRTALRTTASLVALAAIVVGSWQGVEYLNKSKDGQSSAPPAEQSSTPPAEQSGAPLSGATLDYTPSSFNAFGDRKDEHASALPLLKDGKADTAWTTQSYNDPFGGGYRPGTGVLLDLGSARTVGSVVVKLVGGAHTVELKALPGATSAPQTSKAGFDGFGDAIASGTSSNELQLKPKKPVTTRFLLIWLTAIPNDGGGYKGQVAEITVNG
ncbi:protein kinase family protein [Kitasatospora sp. DSM 101779]|uniref:protein kinase family protein n=1 Tax=Kitasatospora sp. DSM 101779 TaxID=2853165 RepID=UPI0021D8B932|nr:protein kinase family protein [Kitasatospora sp. DSM 101779]MCU7823678.1 protein kinase family protein [Kitasatospora sp. DSM 101779]